MTTIIYVLRLAGGHFYVGKTDNVAKRYQQHLDGKGSAWTKKHRPIAVEKTIDKASAFDEDKVTKEYMNRYGIDKVRGGSYVEGQLSDFQMETLNTEIWGANDLCKACGRAGHFVKTCRAKTDVSGKRIEYEEVPVALARSGSSRHVDGSYLSDSDEESDDDSDDY